MGRGPGGMGEGGVDLDPLTGLDNERTPLRGRLLKIPRLRDKYLGHIREIAEQSLDWKFLGPIVAQQRVLIEKAVEEDTRKLSTLEAFQKYTSPEIEKSADTRRSTSLRDFAEKRRAYLLQYKPKSVSE
jgi:hypothetical protein